MTKKRFPQIIVNIIYIIVIFFGTAFSCLATLTGSEYVAFNIRNNDQIRINMNVSKERGMLETLDWHLTYEFKQYQFRNYKFFYESFESSTTCPLYCANKPAKILLNSFDSVDNYFDCEMISGTLPKEKNELICNYNVALLYSISPENLPYKLTAKAKTDGKIIDREVIITGIFLDNFFTKERQGIIDSDYHFISNNIGFKNDYYGFTGCVMPLDGNYFSNWSAINALLSHSDWIFLTLVFDNGTPNVLDRNLINQFKKTTDVLKYISLTFFVLLQSFLIYLYYKKYEIPHSLELHVFSSILLLIFNFVLKVQVLNYISIFILLMLLLLNQIIKTLISEKANKTKSNNII